jgi:hypothetical protein
MYVAQRDDVVSAPRAPASAPIARFRRKYPNITVRSIDFSCTGVGASDSGDLPGLLFEEITSGSPDTVIAYRGGERLVQVYESLPLNEVPAGTDVLRRGGTYLITGGLGSVGLTLAGMLTQRYGAKVGLVSRRAFPAPETWNGWLATHAEDDEVSRQIRKIQGMEAAGGRVIVFTADIADRVRMAEIFAWLEGRYGHVRHFPCSGVITADSTM